MCEEWEIKPPKDDENECDDARNDSWEEALLPLHDTIQNHQHFSPLLEIMFDFVENLFLKNKTTKDNKFFIENKFFSFTYDS